MSLCINLKDNMIVKITNFDENAEVPFIDYNVSDLSLAQLNYLDDNLH